MFKIYCTLYHRIMKFESVQYNNYYINIYKYFIPYWLNPAASYAHFCKFAIKIQHLIYIYICYNILLYKNIIYGIL